MAEYNEWKCKNDKSNIDRLRYTDIDIGKLIKSVCKGLVGVQKNNRLITTCVYGVKFVRRQSENQKSLHMHIVNNTIWLPSSRCSRKSITYKDKCYSLHKSLNLTDTEYRKQRFKVIPKYLLVLFQKHAVCIYTDGSYNISVNPNQDPCDSVAELKYSVLNVYLQKCSKAQFQCGDNHCISDRLLQDGKSDCPDNSDEKYNPLACWDTTQVSNFKDCLKCQFPTCKCLSNYFQCTSGGCIDWNKVCNKINDCSQGSDEQNCEYGTPSMQTIRLFSCHNSNLSIPDRLVGDFVADCPHMEDEISPFPITDDLQKCHLTSHIQCVPGHPRCFPFYQICLYDRDRHGMLRYLILVFDHFLRCNIEFHLIEAERHHQILHINLTHQYTFQNRNDMLIY